MSYITSTTILTIPVELAEYQIPSTDFDCVNNLRYCCSLHSAIATVILFSPMRLHLYGINKGYIQHLN